MKTNEGYAFEDLDGDDDGRAADADVEQIWFVADHAAKTNHGCEIHTRPQAEMPI